ncbi:MAG: signal peptidase II [Halanaerobiaceae bacterium]
MKNIHKLYIMTTILIIIDQGIKFIINAKFFDMYFPIMKPWFYFNPVFNRDYSWVNSLFQLGLSKYFHIIMVTLIIVFASLLYKYILQKKLITELFNITFAFLFSAGICSLVDKIFWNGSLDYIFLRSYFIFDLKDVYVNIFVILVIWMVISNHKGIQEIDEKEFFKGFIRSLFQK